MPCYSLYLYLEGQFLQSHRERKLRWLPSLGERVTPVDAPPPHPGLEFTLHTTSTPCLWLILSFLSPQGPPKTAASCTSCMYVARGTDLYPLCTLAASPGICGQCSRRDQVICQGRLQTLSSADGAERRPKLDTCPWPAEVPLCSGQ